MAESGAGKTKMIKGFNPISKPIRAGRTIAISGYFAPIHSGHINYIKAAKKLGDKLIVIVNNDYQLRKYKKRNYPIEDRISVIRELRDVDMVVESVDSDSRLVFVKRLVLILYLGLVEKKHNHQLIY